MYLEKEIQDFVDRYKPDFVIEYDGGPRELIMVRYQGNAEEVIIPKGINVIGWNGLGTWSEHYGFFKNDKIKKINKSLFNSFM